MKARKANPGGMLSSPTTESTSPPSPGRAGFFEECSAAGLNACDEQIPEWEEIEFLVDSGASATVVRPDQVKAVQATEPNHNRFYKMADGSVIPHKGQKHFRAYTDVGGIGNDDELGRRGYAAPERSTDAEQRQQGRACDRRQLRGI